MWDFIVDLLWAILGTSSTAGEAEPTTFVLVNCPKCAHDKADLIDTRFNFQTVSDGAGSKDKPISHTSTYKCLAENCGHIFERTLIIKI